MQLTNNLKLILAPVLAGAGVFILIFFLFTATYIFFEYRDYRSAYQAEQQVELKTIQQRTDATLKNLKEMLQLTGDRIAASRDNFQRIQNIVISAPRLYTPQELPNVQELVYHVLSKPYKAVSRFGIFPSEAQISSTTPKEPVIGFHDGSIIGKIPVFNENQALKGILEIKVNASALKAFLGEMRAMSFTPLDSSHLPLPFQKLPFPLYDKPADSLFDFAFDNRNRYLLFFFYTLPRSKMKCNAVECLLKTQTQNGVAYEELSSINP